MPFRTCDCRVIEHIAKTGIPRRVDFVVHDKTRCAAQDGKEQPEVGDLARTTKRFQGHVYRVAHHPERHERQQPQQQPVIHNPQPNATGHDHTEQQDEFQDAALPGTMIHLWPGARRQHRGAIRRRGQQLRWNGRRHSR